MNKENNKKDMALLSCGYISLCQTSLDVLLHLKCVLRENTSDHRKCIQEAAFLTHAPNHSLGLPHMHNFI